MKEILENYIKQFTPDTDHKSLEIIMEQLHPVSYSKGELLVKQGEVAHNCYFILKGCMRLFFVDEDGNEHTSGFYIEEDSLSIRESFRHKKPSPFGIQCLEDTVVIEGDLDSEREMKTDFPLLQGMIQDVLEEELDKNQQLQSRFRSMSPEDRYRDFLKSNPGLAERIPQNMLASYLGMKPESLSRIKKRLSQT